MDDKWIDSIKDKMVEYDVVPPTGLLESIQKEVRAKRVRKRLLFFSIIAASIALLVCISMMLIPEVKNETLPEVAESTVKEKEKKDKEPSKVIAENTAHTVAHRSITQLRVEGRITSAASDSDSDVSEAKDIVETNGNVDKSKKKIKEKIEGSCDSFAENVDRVEPIVLPTQKQSPLSVGVAASANGLGGMFEDADLDGRPNYASMPFTRMGGGSITHSSNNGYTPPTFVELFNHRLPVRFSIDFSWPIAHGLDVGTGVCYSYLRSDIKYGYSDSQLFKATQNLHFIGIPVNLRYTPWSFRNFNVYTSVGFMAEKCIGGQIKEESSSESRYSYKGADDRPFQFSFNAAAGIQYDMTNNCAVFIEPGFGVYLKNGSKLRTIYSERPLTFNVNVGLRFAP